jgi:hypothetical protein
MDMETGSQSLPGLTLGLPVIIRIRIDNAEQLAGEFGFAFGI